MNIRMTLTHMAAAEVEGMVPPPILARLKALDPHPLIKAFVVGHEGDVQGTVAGVGSIAVRFFRAIIERLDSLLYHGTPAYHRHASSPTERREVIGEVVGKKLQNVDGVARELAAIYIRPEHRDKVLDVASIEWEVDGTFSPDGTLEVSNTSSPTGIALSDGTVDQPGFPGATLLGLMQHFTGSAGDTSMAFTKDEIQAAMKSLKLKPSDLYTADELKVDPVITGHISAELAAANTRATNAEQTLATERAAWNSTSKATTDQLRALQKDVTGFRMAGTFADVVKARNYTAPQIALLKTRLGDVTTEAATPEGVKEAVQKWMDGAIVGVNETLKEMGIEIPDPAKNANAGGTDGNTNPGGGPGSASNAPAKLTADNANDPKVNPLIPQPV